MVFLGRPYHFKFFKACLPQTLFGPLLNTLSHFFRLFSLLLSIITYKHYLAVVAASAIVFPNGSL